MPMVLRFLLPLLVALYVPGTYAGEWAERAAFRDEFDVLFAKEDFASIERRYAQTLASKRRTSGGWSEHDWLLRLVPKSGLKLPPAATSAAASGDQFREAQFVDVEAKISRWVKQFPTSTFATLTLSRVLINRGFDFRGQGYASSVSPENMKRFEEYVARAHDLLTSKPSPKDPEWYVAMIRVARFQGWDAARYATLVAEATAAFPDYPRIYIEAFEKLLPKWGGSMPLASRFADAAVQKTQATEGKTLYARLYLNFGHFTDDELLQNNGAEWKKIRAGFDDLVKRHPDPLNISNYAQFACRLGDKAAVKALQPLLARVPPEPVAWPSRIAYLQCKNWGADAEPALK